MCRQNKEYYWLSQKRLPLINMKWLTSTCLGRIHHDCTDNGWSLLTMRTKFIIVIKLKLRLKQKFKSINKLKEVQNDSFNVKFSVEHAATVCFKKIGTRRLHTCSCCMIRSIFKVVSARVPQSRKSFQRIRLKHFRPI